MSDARKDRQHGRKLIKVLRKLCEDRDFLTCDRILEKMDTERVSDTALLCVLTAIAPYKERLSHHAGFVERVRNMLYYEHDADTVRDMLRGLE